MPLMPGVTALPMGLTEPDLILPSQWPANQRKPLRGEERLLLAMLEDAAMDLHHYRGMRHPPSAVQRYREALQWVEHPRRTPFSFVFACETLHIDPDYLRKALQRRCVGVLRKRWRRLGTIRGCTVAA